MIDAVINSNGLRSLVNATSKNDMPMIATNNIIRFEIHSGLPRHKKTNETNATSMVSSTAFNPVSRINPDTAPKILPASYAAHPAITLPPMSHLRKFPLRLPNFRESD